MNSGTSLGHVDMPVGFFHPDLHLYDLPTVCQRLEEQEIPRATTENGSVCHRCRAAEFPRYLFIEPCYFGSGQNDEHPPTEVMHGEALLATVYNELRSNQGLWESALFLALYDEHGGFYDHVAAPTMPPGNNTKTFAFEKLGVRTPALLISP